MNNFEVLNNYDELSDNDKVKFHCYSIINNLATNRDIPINNNRIYYRNCCYILDIIDISNNNVKNVLLNYIINIYNYIINYPNTIQYEINVQQ
jgi:hypothetical protein